MSCFSHIEIQPQFLCGSMSNKNMVCNYQTLKFCFYCKTQPQPQCQTGNQISNNCLTGNSWNLNLVTDKLCQTSIKLSLMKTPLMVSKAKVSLMRGAFELLATVGTYPKYQIIRHTIIMVKIKSNLSNNITLDRLVLHFMMNPTINLTFMMNPTIMFIVHV